MAEYVNSLKEQCLIPKNQLETTFDSNALKK